MSLLMKALEKAAKDREETDGERASAAPDSAMVAPGTDKTASDLSLEPIAQQPRTTPAAAAREPVASPRRPGAAMGAPTAQSAQAATLMRAGQREAGGGRVRAYGREHPLVVFGGLAALFLAGYGTYVYLQTTNPGMFVKQLPPPKSSPTPLTKAPIVAPGDSTTITAQSPNDSTAVATQSPIALNPLLPTLPAAEHKDKPIPQPIPPAATVAPGTAASATGSAAPTATARTTAPAAVSRPAPAAPRDTIRVTAGSDQPSISPVLAEAYQSLNTGDLDTSQRLYSQLLRGDPNNVDALLGLAAIATQQSDSAQASKHYLRILEVEPRNALAQAGLIGMLGRADPLAAETRLKQLIAREPSAFLYFTLGNVYADQNRWPDAQQAYFQAYHLQPNNPDYAYNLAVGLEHVGQPKLALNFYRGALQLATTGRANFSTAAAQERISKLEKTVQ